MNPVAWRSVHREGPSVVALGNFDGVHLGHRRLLQSLVAEGAASGLKPVLVTFEPHPRFFFKPQVAPALLTTPREKMALLSEWPIEILPLAFDADLAGLEAADFIDLFLKQRLQGKRFLLGHDHRFGKGAKGDATLVQRHVSDPARDVLILEPFRLDGETVSSSAIRAHLEAGRIEQANRLLGRCFSYSGKVVKGEERGRLLGFPTANLDIGYPWKVMVAFGVYGGRAFAEGKQYAAIANIGRHPTFGGDAVHIEVHVLDFTGNLYDADFRFDLEFSVRPEKRFPSVDALKAQIGEDIALVRARMGANPQNRP
ncbi:MAG: riboflavin biosynthesis protein RibF [Fibrobacteres bacterium]|nr:riboflavin biosynthesis protein RibF [Fibrobacterota bacterium]